MLKLIGFPVTFIVLPIINSLLDTFSFDKYSISESEKSFATIKSPSLLDCIFSKIIKPSFSAFIVSACNFTKFIDANANDINIITKVKKDWNSSEHLIEYPKQYEYAIEIKTNPKNIPGKGSAIFLHCSAERPTAGCIAIDAKFMKFLLDRIENDAIICIEI